MSFLISPARFGAGGPNLGAGNGTLVARTTTASSATGAVPWESEVRDQLLAFNSGTSTTDIVIPSGMSYGRLIGQSNGGFATRILKGGAAFDGNARQAGFADVGLQNLVSAIVAVSAADAFTLDRLSAGAPAARTWMSLEAFSGSARFCSARRNATQAITASAANIAFDTALHETESMHSGGLFTVPGDAVFIRGSASFRGDASSTLSRGSILEVGMTVGGSVTQGCFKSTVSRAAATTNSVGGASAIIPVSGGESVRFTARASQSQNIGGNTETWGQLEVLPANTEFVTAYLSAGFSVTTSPAGITWGAELHKTKTGFHDNSTNPARITNPIGSGFTECRVAFGAQAPAGPITVTVVARKNGSHVAGLPMGRGTESSGLAALGDWVAIAEGEYIEIQIQGTSSFTLGTNTATWVCVEFR